MIPEGRLNYLLTCAQNALAGDTDVLRQLGRGVPELVQEIRVLQERLRAVESALPDAFMVDADRGYLKLSEALRGPAEAPATEEERALWAKYFDNAENRERGRHVPWTGFRDKYSMTVLRCNYCAYLNGGLVHMLWHEAQPEWKTERMLIERKEKLGE